MLIDDMHILQEFFSHVEGIDENMTGKERQRLFSAGVRNNGFIDKAYDVARENPEFLPAHFDMARFAERYQRFEVLRQFMTMVQQLLRMVTDVFLVEANACVKDALRVYASLREQAHSKVAGAADLFALLRNYFNRGRKKGAAEQPTEKQIERDVRRLVRGTADGTVMVENLRPRMLTGLHKIVDNIRTGRAEAAESVVMSDDAVKKIG